MSQQLEHEAHSAYHRCLAHDIHTIQIVGNKGDNDGRSLVQLLQFLATYPIERLKDSESGEKESPGPTSGIKYLYLCKALGEGLQDPRVLTAFEHILSE